MKNASNKPITAFWIITVVALLWNIMGVLAYLGQAFMTEEALSLLPEADQLYYNNVPAWVTAAFAIAVFGGTIGCIALFLRKKIALLLFILSLLGILTQSTYTFFIQDYVEITGKNIGMPITIIIFAAFLIWFSMDSQKKEILT
jgi:hypothetical protein